MTINELRQLLGLSPAEEFLGKVLPPEVEEKVEEEMKAQAVRVEAWKRTIMEYVLANRISKR